MKITMKQAQKALLIFLFLAMQLQQCMQAKKFSPQEIVLRLVTTHYLNHHKALCAFGLTSKDNDNLMRSLKEQRKTVVLSMADLDYCSEGSVINHKIDEWHPYGSAYSSIAYTVSINLHKEIQGFSCKLVYPLLVKVTYGTHKIKRNSNAITPLAFKPFMYKKEKNWHFYGIKTVPYSFNEQINGIGYPHAVCRFTVAGPTFPCELSIENPTHPESTISVDILDLLDYPILVKAILDAPAKKTQVRYNNIHGIRKRQYYLTYSLKNVVLPNNYRKYEKYPQQLLTIDPWNFRDKYIGDAIDRHYDQQKAMAAIDK